jgi:hypothetical protein
VIPELTKEKKGLTLQTILKLQSFNPKNIDGKIKELLSRELFLRHSFGKFPDPMSSIMPKLLTLISGTKYPVFQLLLLVF